ncbi:hypothetical protein BKA70DRAFT_1251152 [Coprinopsis sp. MPI-PUGE-AT-0042]|nr:hypothetical protein BKA70DRAFT_1251152 [Coprinopsis sp. MPI-PUGE-AT-0042]
MSPLSAILNNPESIRQSPHSNPNFDPLSFASTTQQHARFQPGRDTTSRMGVADKHPTWDHPPHPNCPDTLACLPDTDGRPQHTLPVILRCAILGSPRKRLTIREIYGAMEDKYSYYKSAGPTWKQSVRHHLSLNRLFERQPRPVTDPGFGSYWTVNLTAPPGTKRPRKRGRSSKSTAAPVNIDDFQVAPHLPSQNQISFHHHPQSHISQPHPHQHASSSNPSPLSSLHVSPTGTPPQLGPDTMGEPPYLVDDRRHSYGSAPSLPPTGTLRDVDDEDDVLSRYDDCPPESGDEYDSEDDLVHDQYDRHSHPYRPPPPSQGFQLPPIASLDSSQSHPSLVERLQAEIDHLRRQSAEAVSVSLRLSEKLAQAEAEVSRSRSAVQDLEDMLEDETVRRKEAERQASEEAHRRRMTEEAYRIPAHHRGPPMQALGR